MTTETTNTPEVKKTAYELACEKLKREPLTIDAFSVFPEANRKVMFGQHKKDTCIEAANLDAEGKPFIPCWTDGSYKYFPWYLRQEDTNRPSGVGFRFCNSVNDDDGTYLGSRLGYCRTRQIADEIGRNDEITEYHNEAMGI